VVGGGYAGVKAAHRLTPRNDVTVTLIVCGGAERASNRLKRHRAVATRSHKRGYVFFGPTTAAVLVIRLRT
jgi:NADH dehydrogenase FAD-containing subunit